MRILTYNVWHGLSPEGLLVFRALEPQGRKERRLEAQIKLFHDLDCDLIFLQEVNPVSELAKVYAQRLGYQEVHQPDQMGVKFVGYGVPLNLETGLVILARPVLNLRKLRGLKLSGPLGFLSDRVSFQLAEFRFSLLAEITSAKLGRLLLINAHLFHGLGPEPLAEIALSGLEDLLRHRKIAKTQFHQMKERIYKDERRRKLEVSRVIDAIIKLRREYDGVILAGDFNFTPFSSCYSQLTESGLVDLFTHCNPSSEGFTWSQSNSNVEWSKDFSFGFADPHIKDLLAKIDQRSKRVDYVFSDPGLAQGIEHSFLVGDRSIDGLLPSDHYGVLAESP